MARNIPNIPAAAAGILSEIPGTLLPPPHRLRTELRGNPRACPHKTSTGRVGQSRGSRHGSSQPSSREEESGTAELAPGKHRSAPGGGPRCTKTQAGLQMKLSHLIFLPPALCCLPTPIPGSRSRDHRQPHPWGRRLQHIPAAAQGALLGIGGEKPRNWPCYSCWDLGGDKLMIFHPRASGELIGRELR